MWCWSWWVVIVIFIHYNFFHILIYNMIDNFCIFRFYIVLICHLRTSSSLPIISKPSLILLHIIFLNYIVLTILHTKLRNFVLHSLLWLLCPIASSPLTSLYIFLVVIFYLFIRIIYKLVLVIFISITISVIIIVFILIIVIVICFNGDSNLLLNQIFIPHSDSIICLSV